MTDVPPTERSLWEELQRRRVVRVGVMYLVCAWVAVQVAATVLPALGLRVWAVRLVIVLATLGFPLALSLAWLFDIRGGGVRRGEATPARLALPLRASVVLLVIVFAGFGYAAAMRGVRAPAEGSIAVLPFANLSEAAANEYFSDGVHEDLLAHLARVKDLRVLSRTSVMTYKGGGKTARQIAAELDARYILEGTVRRDQNRVRITAQLIDAAEDRHIWGETYDRELTDIFRIQTEIARHIADALHARLSPSERARIAAAPTGNVTAYDYYLQGRDYYYRFNRVDNDRAIALFRQALALDSTYALALAGLARAYMWRPSVDAAWRDSARIAAERAVRYGPEEPETHSALGELYRISLQPEQALASYRRALELDPRHVVSHAEIGQTLFGLGKLVESIQAVQRAIEIEPATAWHYRVQGRTYHALGDLAEAERLYNQGLALQPGQFQSLSGLALIYEERGDTARARMYHTAAVDAAPANALANLFWFHARQGALDDASATLARMDSTDGAREPAFARAYLLRMRGGPAAAEPLIAQWERGEAARTLRHPVDLMQRARAAALRGQNDAALELLRAWRRAGGVDVVDLRHLPVFRELEGTAAYRAIVEEAERERDRLRALLARKAANAQPDVRAALNLLR